MTISRDQNRSREPLRVLHLIAHLGRGGTERQLALLLGHLDPARIASTVAFFNSSDNDVWDSELRGHGVEIVDLTSVRGSAKRMLAVARVARRREIDVLHSWTLHTNAYSAVSGLLARVPVRWGSLRGSLHSSGFRSLPKYLQWLCLRGVQRLVVNADALGRQLQDHGVDSERIVVVPNGVESPAPIDRDAVRTELGCRPGDILIGAVGNLRAIKNHQLLIDAMAEVVPQQPDARAVIIGQPLASEPGVREALEERIRSLGLERQVRLVGFRDNAAAMIAAFDVLTLTSHSEGLPNAILEAMVVGVPVVAVDVGGVRQLVDDRHSGLVVPPGNPHAFAGALLQLLNDVEARTAYGLAAKQRARQHHPSAMADRLAQLYLKACA